MRILITGTSRGIGLELARQLASRGDTVEACARAPESSRALAALAKSNADRVHLHALDVASDDSVAALATRIEGPLDAVINNAGVYGDHNSLRSLDRAGLAEMKDLYTVNALGPLRVSLALLPQILSGKTKKILNVSTGMSKLAEGVSGGSYGYRMSKVALNMMTRTLATDLRSQGVITAVINPGWVKTDMGGQGAPTSVEESARGIIAWLDKMELRDSGDFLDFKGQKTAW